MHCGDGRQATGDINVFTVPCSEVLGLHETSVNVSATRNSSVQTASLQCFGVISKSCSFVDLDQIKHVLKYNRPRIETILRIALKFKLSRSFPERRSERKFGKKEE